jgi:hypothetical protein
MNDVVPERLMATLRKLQEKNMEHRARHEEEDHLKKEAKALKEELLR